LAGCVGVAATIFSFEIDDKENLGRQVIETADRISDGMGKAKWENFSTPVFNDPVESVRGLRLLMDYWQKKDAVEK
jgi:hypothetical protein